MQAIADNTREDMTIIAYHGTDSDFDRFDASFAGQNTDDNATDESFARTAHIGFWFNVGGDITFGDKIMTCELSVSNPYHIDSLVMLAITLRDQTAEELRDWLIDNGYDSIIVDYDEELGGTSYVVFRPEQIRIMEKIISRKRFSHGR